MIKAVLFDVDGTLISLKFVVEAINETAQLMGLRGITTNEIYSNIVGYSLKDKLKQIYPEINDKQVEEFRKKYHEIYKAKKEKLLPNARETIEELKSMNIKIGIVTTKSRDTATEALEETKLKYDVLITSEDVSRIKPDAEPVLKALEKLKIKPEEAVMVGDHNFDIQSAKNAGVVAIGIDTGAKTADELAKEEPDYLIHNLIQVVDIIKELNGEDEVVYEAFDLLNIPKDRVAVLIGKKGETKKEIERQTGTKIQISSDGEVIIRRKMTTSPIKQIKAKEVCKAIARGFSPEKAFKLFKQENYLEVISLTEFVSNKSLNRVRARIIGREGRVRKLISRATKTEIVIYGKTVSIIGKIKNIELAKNAIIKIIKGAPHSAVFRYLARNKLKLE